MKTLDGINWERGQHWDGICGKMRADGVFSTAGGAKDSGHATYTAITDTTDSRYKIIRGQQSATGSEAAIPVGTALVGGETPVTAEHIN